MRYRLSVAAKEDLRRIYRHGFYTFGEVQADKYFLNLTERFQQIADSSHLYPIADEIDTKLRKSLCGVDVIYYELTDTGVFIVRILGRQSRETSFL